MNDKCCECVNGKIKTPISRTMRIGFIDLQCPCDCHKEKPMKDEKLDLDGLKQVVSEMLWPGNNPAKIMIDDLVKEVERLCQIELRLFQYQDRIIEIEEENEKLHANAEQLRICGEYKAGYTDKWKKENAEMRDEFERTINKLEKENAKLQEEVERLESEKKYHEETHERYGQND